MRRGSAVKYEAKRLAWARANPHMMVGVPSMAQDVDEAGRARLDALESALMAEGLLGGTRIVRRETVRRMVGELRDGTFATVPW